MTNTKQTADATLFQLKSSGLSFPGVARKTGLSESFVRRAVCREASRLLSKGGDVLAILDVATDPEDD